MSRYIDADELLKHVKDLRINTAEGYEFRHRCIDPQYVYEAPTADVVPVVRCASCRFYDPEWKFCNHHRTGRAPDYYCASGRTKE